VVLLWSIVALGGCGRTGLTVEDDYGEGSVALGTFDAEHSHACLVGTAGRVRCWGGDHALCVPDATDPQPVPVEVPGVDDAVGLATGWDHSCILHADGRLGCCGRNYDGALGDGTRFSWSVHEPVEPRGLGNVVQVVAALHTCALTRSGSVWCWGANDHGELGDGSTEDRTVPVRVDGIEDAVELAAGRDHTCARLASGNVLCWGRNDWGQLGDGSTRSSAVPVPVRGIERARRIAAGSGQSCAITSRGYAQCWGLYLHEDGTNDAQPNPWYVRGLRDVVDVAPGGASCAVLRGGDVWCWGDDYGGRLGPGVTGIRERPVAIEGVDGAVRVTVGFAFACALLDDRRVLCWGSNTAGQLGDGTFTSSESPVEVMNLE